MIILQKNLSFVVDEDPENPRQEIRRRFDEKGKEK